MKKGKRTIISKVDNGDFSFQDEGFNMDETPMEPFPGFDVPPVDYIGNQEHDAKDELRYVHDSLLWVDKHPPQTGNVLDSPIFLTVVFESRSQKNAFLDAVGLYEYGDKYFSFKTWCNAFGLDVEKGTPISITPNKHGAEEETPSLSFSDSFDFSDFGKSSKTEKVIGETLQNIRNDEKRTVEYLSWAVDPSFWFCICFQTELQKTNFQRSLGIQSEKYSGLDVIWCYDFAKPFQVELEPCDFKPRLWSGKEDKRLTALVWKGETE